MNWPISTASTSCTMTIPLKTSRFDSPAGDLNAFSVWSSAYTPPWSRASVRVPEDRSEPHDRANRFLGRLRPEIGTVARSTIGPQPARIGPSRTSHNPRRHAPA